MDLRRVPSQGRKGGSGVNWITRTNWIKVAWIAAPFVIVIWYLIDFPTTDRGIAVGKHAAYEAEVEKACETMKLGADTGSQRIMARDMCEKLREEVRKTRP